MRGVSMSTKDPTKAMIDQARSYPNAVEGTSCSQTSFKTAGKKAYFYIGMQGGRYKAMFKLKDSLPEAMELAKQHPDDYQAGSIGWLTARFTAEHPMEDNRWKRWLEESYQLSLPATKKKSQKKAAK